MVSESERTQSEHHIQTVMNELATIRHHPVICLCGDMDEVSVLKVRECANQLKDFRKISVLLHSSGGDIEDAYRIILALRENAEELDVLVPHWAKSAATFFCLAADNILMGRYGELGPLDPQRLDPRGSARPTSALESFKALDQLLGYSLDSLDSIVLHLLQQAPLDIPYAIEHAQPLFAAIVSPLYSKVDLHELGDAGRALSVSEEYAARALERWGQPQSSYQTRQKIARRLVWDYPTHGFVIDLAEALEMGLNAAQLDEESEEICRKIIDFNEDYIGTGFPKVRKIRCTRGGEKEWQTRDRGTDHEQLAQEKTHEGTQAER